ncbi:hypothetical protein BC830DRAFT_1150276 [Chytriomyces sp. MP71]|nr:hypothetical protein BC830DRAFT_1150276 [Chytriomyces sp. MP71]
MADLLGPTLTVPGTSDKDDGLTGLSAKEKRQAQRRCIAEDAEWNLALVEKLSELCLRVIVANFEKSHQLNGIPAKHRERVLSSISVNLPLSIAAPLIPDESYWKRRAAAHFKNCDPNLSSTSKAIGNGVGGFGGGLMGIAPLVGPTEKVRSAALSVFNVTSMEDVWMGFGKPGSAASAADGAAVSASIVQPTTVSSNINLGAPGSAAVESVPLATPESLLSRTGSFIGAVDKPSSKGADKAVRLVGPSAGKWKNLFFELHIQNLVESFSPKKIGGMDDVQELQKELRLAAPCLTRLDIRQLKPTELLEGEIVKSTDLPPDHLDIGLIMGELVFLKDLKIYYGVRDCGMNFDWKIFGMTFADCGNLANAVRLTTSLETLVIQASGICGERARLLASGLLENKSIRKLDLSHNKICDRGVRGIAKLLAVPGCILTHLDLSNNQIKEVGAHSLGKALQFNSTLIHFNLRMNRFGDAGGADFCACLSKVVALVPTKQIAHPILPTQDGVVPRGPAQYVQSSLCSLDMASNGLGMDTVQALCVLLKKGGKNLRYLDFSCNRLGEAAKGIVGGTKTQTGGRSGSGKGDSDVAGKMLFEAVSQNKYITHFDLRVTDLSTEHLIAIKGIVSENAS